MFFCVSILCKLSQIGDLGDNGCAAGAQVGKSGIAAHLGVVLPAAAALGALGLGDQHADTGNSRFSALSSSR